MACIAGMAILMFGTEEEKQLLKDYVYFEALYDDYPEAAEKNLDDIEKIALRILGPAFKVTDFYQMSIGRDTALASDYIRTRIADYENEVAGLDALLQA